MHEAVERAALREVLALHPLDVGEVLQLARRHLVDVAVGIARAQQRLAMRAQLRVGVGRRADVVRPVVDRGDAGVGELDQPEHHAVVEIVGRVELGGGVLRRKIAKPIGDEVASERAPHVVMRIDEARHDDHVGRIDHLRTARGEIRPDRLDAAVAHQHVAPRQHAELRIHGDDRAVLDQVTAARGGARFS